MTANPLIACNPTTSQYDFAYPLSWSNACEIADVLSDIPFISVGSLVFGVSALFFVMKRVPLSAVWFFISALLAFVAALLDLGQTLADGIVMNAVLITGEPIMRAREVLFALSIGFRFLFYWSYVAEPPQKNLSAPSPQTFRGINLLSLDYDYESHSGSWVRWGLPGKLFCVGLFLTIMAITALQIVWRVVPEFHQYSNVYGTDAALELLVSFLLLLKLLLNTVTLNSPDSVLLHTLRECLAPISGLLVNIAIGVGNLLCFAFTESTVGRLLQAFEMYIIVVFVAITALLRHCAILLSTASSQGIEHKDIMFMLPEPTRRSTFRITPPFIETPRISTILSTVIQKRESGREVLRHSARRSLNNVSSWLSSRISRTRTRDDEVRLWNVEKTKVDPQYLKNIDTELAQSSVSLTQDSKDLTELIRDASANHMMIFSTVDAQSAAVRLLGGSNYDSQILHPSRADVLRPTMSIQVQKNMVPVSPVSSPISSEMKHTRSMAATPEPSPIQLASPFDLRTPLDGFLGRQSRLGQSTEALKLFSARTSDSLHSNSALSPRNVELERSPSTGQRTVSSDVSLSNFPVPPWLITSIPYPPSSSPSSIRRIRENRRARLAAVRPTPVQDTCTSVSMTTVSPADMPGSPYFNSIPHSPRKESKSLSVETWGPSRLDSGGTQYNVTSFIGGLATPGEPRQANQEKPLWRIESESSIEASQTSSSIEKLPLRILPVPWRLEGLPGSPAATLPSPLALPVALPAHTPATDHAEKGGAIPSTKPQRVGKTGSSMTFSEDGTHRVQRMFVRPRPPPLAIQSYTEQNLSRIQVLTDD